MKTSARTPDDYLDATLRVIAEDGAPKLTLAQVAAAAGVSKGGLLHHYPSKDALLKGLLEREAARFREAVARQQEILGDGPGAKTRALIEASFETEACGQGLLLSLLATVFERPELLNAFRADWVSYRQSFLNDGLPEAQAILVQLALDGLYFADVLGLEPPTGKLRDDLRQTLLSLTKGS